MVEVIAKGLGANSKKPREIGRAFLTASHAGVVFPAPRVPTALQTLSCNSATAPMPPGCVLAWLQQNEGGTQPLMAQILRYKARQLVSNYLMTDR